MSAQAAFGIRKAPGHVIMGIFSFLSCRREAGAAALTLGRLSRVRRDLVAHFVAGCDDVLDVGCGTGRLVVQCALAGASVVGFDTNEEMIAAASRRIESARIDDKARVMRLDVSQMREAFKPASFDRVFTVFTLSRLDPPERKIVVSQAMRVLSPGGLFFVLDRMRTKKGPGGLLRALLGAPVAAVACVVGGSRTRPLDEPALALARAGFDIVDAETFVPGLLELLVGRKPRGDPQKR